MLAKQKKEEGLFKVAMNECMCPNARSRLFAAVLMLRAEFFLDIVLTLRLGARGACQLPDYTSLRFLQTSHSLPMVHSSTPAGA